MTDVTNILYWVSTGLMIPVVALLLIAFIRSMVLLGGFFSLFISRLKFEKALSPFIQKLRKEPHAVSNEVESLKSNYFFYSYLVQVLATREDEIYGEKLLMDFEAEADKELGVSKTLGRMGPMLGLMGTLIPMGPALVGLAAGDIASMAQNMQVAFSTTVVGLFAGGVGYITQLVKQRWFIADLNNLEYVNKVIRK